MKIEDELRKRGLTDYCVRKGLEEIDDEEYHSVASGLIHKKWESLKGNKFEKFEKTKRFMASKGYEFSLINKLLEDCIKREDYSGL